MRHFRGVYFPGGEFRPLYTQQAQSEREDFAVGLPVTRIDQTGQAELLVGERSIAAVVLSEGASFVPAPEAVVVPEPMVFQSLPLPSVRKA